MPPRCLDSSIAPEVTLRAPSLVLSQSCSEEREGEPEEVRRHKRGYTGAFYAEVKLTEEVKLPPSPRCSQAFSQSNPYPLPLATAQLTGVPSITEDLTRALLFRTHSPRSDGSRSSLSPRLHTKHKWQRIPYALDYVVKNKKLRYVRKQRRLMCISVSVMHKDVFTFTIKACGANNLV